jgi:hypothetical protein
MPKKQIVKLIPPSKTKCQTYWPESSFMTLGPCPQPVRCNQPVVAIIREKELQLDGQRGAMGVCKDCLAIALKRNLPVTVEYLKEKK